MKDFKMLQILHLANEIYNGQLSCKLFANVNLRKIKQIHFHIGKDLNSIYLEVHQIYAMYIID